MFMSCSGSHPNRVSSANGSTPSSERVNCVTWCEADSNCISFKILRLKRPIKKKKIASNYSFPSFFCNYSCAKFGLHESKGGIHQYIKKYSQE